ncbi:universal stress protein [Kitasatospora sp. NPDC001159]
MIGGFTKHTEYDSVQIPGFTCRSDATAESPPRSPNAPYSASARVTAAVTICRNTSSKSRSRPARRVPPARSASRRPASPVLLEQARGTDLLVVGSRGHGGFGGALLGSMNQHCVQHATCPVAEALGTAGGRS